MNGFFFKVLTCCITDLSQNILQRGFSQRPWHTRGKHESFKVRHLHCLCILQVNWIWSVFCIPMSAITNYPCVIIYKNNSSAGSPSIYGQTWACVWGVWWALGISRPGWSWGWRHKHPISWENNIWEGFQGRHGVELYNPPPPTSWSGCSGSTSETRRGQHLQMVIGCRLP